MPTAKPDLRMTPTYFHILLSLADGDAHGYAIMREVEARTDGSLVLGPGSLYWAIGRLEKAGLIVESDRRPKAEDDDERRRYYRLTREGRSVLERESQVLAGIVEHARARKLLKPQGRTP